MAAQPKPEAVVTGIEKRLERDGRIMSNVPVAPIRLKARKATPLREAAFAIFKLHRQRALVCLALMVAQAYFYNAIFFTYPLVLTTFYGVSAEHLGWYILPFAAGNFLGPVFLGRLFDTWGRRPMLALTYAGSGLLLAMTGYAFATDSVSAAELTVAWAAVFFVASAAASAAYLTVSETFPLEVRALAIALFYAVGTAIGGVVGPWLLGYLIDTGSRMTVIAGYLIGTALMLAAAIIAAIWATPAERRPLEAVARPLASAD
jgi:MFS family permease